MLSCKGLCLEYPDGTAVKTVLKNIELAIAPSEKVVLLGPSGSGKSLLIYLLSSLRAPTAGEVYFKGKQLSALKRDQQAAVRRKHFSFIFQMHFLLPYLTAVENVLVGKNDFSKASRAEAEELLSRLGLAEHVDKRLHQMSGGERQRVAIARALINKPDVIFADEPTASLDHATAIDVIHTLKNHSRDCALVMATHDTSILEGDERQIRLANGNTAEAGWTADGDQAMV